MTDQINMRDEIIEAMCECEYPNGTWGNLEKNEKEWHRKSMEAALDAALDKMMKPDVGMTDVGGEKMALVSRLKLTDNNKFLLVYYAVITTLRSKAND